MVNQPINLELFLDAAAKYLSDDCVVKLKRCYEFAEKAHINQKRKSGEPYITHPLSVAFFLTEFRLDCEGLCAALLHDTVEDTGVSLDDIEHTFGKNVRDLVDGVTKVEVTAKFDSREKRSVALLKKMFLLMARDVRVALIKLVDRLHNMMTLDHLREDKQLAIARETMDIYYPLTRLLGIGRITEMLADHALKYIYSTEYQKISTSFREYSDQYSRYIHDVQSTVDDAMKSNNIHASVSGGLKSVSRIFKIMRRERRSFQDVKDVYAFKLIVNSTKECYSALGVIHSLWKPDVSRFKDFIGVPKINNYKGLHATVFGPGGIKIQFMIYTREMALQADYGVCSQWITADSADIPKLYRDKSQWIDQLIELVENDDDQEFLERLKLDILQDRILVFTPEGRVIDLPAGATPLDFAYAIHTDIGNRFHEVYVNNSKVPINYQLSTGDSVKIITHSDVRPDLVWLDYVATYRAKNAIRNFASSEGKEVKIRLGRDLLMRTLKRQGVNSLDSVEKGSVFRKALKSFGFDDKDKLYIGIADGSVLLQDFIELICVTKPAFLEYLFSSEQYVQNTDRHVVPIQIIGIDRPGMLAAISTCIASHDLNIASFRVASLFGSRKFRYICTVEVSSEKVLDDLFSAIETIDGVHIVQKIIAPAQLIIRSLCLFILVFAFHFFFLYLTKLPYLLFYGSYLVIAVAFFRFMAALNSAFLSFYGSFARLTYFISSSIILFTVLSWEVSYLGMPAGYWEYVYLIFIVSPIILLHGVMHVIRYLESATKLSFFSSTVKAKQFENHHLLVPDPGRKEYKALSERYEKYLFTTYQKSYEKYDCWKGHFENIHNQIDALIPETGVKDKIIAVFGCGPDPAHRDLSPRILAMLREKKLSKLVLIDFSRIALISAIQNLLAEGVSAESIIAYQIDITRGASSYFSNRLDHISRLEAHDIPSAFAKLTNELFRMETHFSLPSYKLEDPDRFDFFISSMFATSTLLPAYYDFRSKMRMRFKDSSTRDSIRLASDNFFMAYDEKMLTLTTQFIIDLGKPQQRGLVVTDVEKIFKDKQKSESRITTGIGILTKELPLVSKHTMYNWVWQDEDDHYHKIQSLLFDVSQKI
jgi:GTP pyrophosphokinase/guanosine-3',5'-bis(diphosphate) 3'-pyrophosphohydrolase